MTLERKVAVVFNFDLHSNVRPLYEIQSMSNVFQVLKLQY